MAPSVICSRDRRGWLRPTAMRPNSGANFDMAIQRSQLAMNSGLNGVLPVLQPDAFLIASSSTSSSSAWADVYEFEKNRTRGRSPWRHDSSRGNQQLTEAPLVVSFFSASSSLSALPRLPVYILCVMRPCCGGGGACPPRQHPAAMPPSVTHRYPLLDVTHPFRTPETPWATRRCGQAPRSSPAPS